MALYTTAHFGESLQRAELLDRRNVVFVAERDGQWLGYATLRDGEVPACVQATSVIEIDRLYVASQHIGARVGAMLMQHCLDHAAAMGKDFVWLNVWEQNARAIRFYERWGFERVGSVPYILGTDLQTDFVMVRRAGEHVR
jgi:ribosomal protein S18 acetylase RimI-like enzyme